MGRWIVGNGLITVGLVWVAVNRALVGLFPLSWGGPNIGGGFIVLLAYAAIVAGIVVILTALSDDRAARQGAPVDRPRLSRTAGAMSLAAAVAAVAMIVSPPGPGGSGTVGTMGVTVDSTGAPVLVLVVCERAVRSVRLSGPYRGVPNEVLAELTSSAGITSTTLLPLTDLPAGWTGGPVALPLVERPEDLVIASARGDQARLRQVSFTATDLISLDPTRLLVEPDRTISMDQLATLCP